LTKIDISEWDVSNVKTMMEMFTGCKSLESIGDISDWKIESLTDITGMFYGCDKLTNTGDLNKWDASKIKFKQNAFSQANESIIPKWA
jgi:surface protein